MWILFAGHRWRNQQEAPIAGHYSIIGIKLLIANGFNSFLSPAMTDVIFSFMTLPETINQVYFYIAVE